MGADLLGRCRDFLGGCRNFKQMSSLLKWRCFREVSLFYLSGTVVD